MKSARHLKSMRPVAFVALAVLTILGMAGIATATHELDPRTTDIVDPDIRPNDGGIQAYCDENYPGTTGVTFSTGSATTNSQGELTKTEAGYTLTWVESTDASQVDYDIAVISITEAGSPTEPLPFTLVVAFLGGNDANGYEFVPDEYPLPGADHAELIVDGGNGQNITQFGFCAFTTGEISVEKVTNPNDSTQSFDFTGSWDGGSFSLANGEDISSGRIAPGSYAVEETVPAGWSLDSVVCTSNLDNRGPYEPDAIDLVVGETVTCVFTNIQQGRILVEKQTDPDGSTQLFTFEPSWSDDNFQLSDGQTNDSGYLDPDSYDVSEAPLAGWTQTSATCTSSIAGQNPYTPDSIDLSAGETVTCTFNNRQDAFIIVEKVTDPVDATDEFPFVVDFGDNFSLAGGGSETSDPLTPGTYSVSETVPAGWELTSATCDDGSDPGTISLQAGETVTCTFNNQADANIIVEKQTDPDGSPQEFTFDPSWSDDNFQLSDGQTNDSGDIGPGTYSVSETVPAGWTQTGATCTSSIDGQAPYTPDSIDLSAGETVTCVFTNRQDAFIVVEKETDPDGSTQAFTFSTDYGGDFNLADGESNTSDPLTSGTYSVSESVPDGWTLTSATCDDESDPSSINLGAGETVTCTFTNTQDGSITVVKQTDPDQSEGAFTFDPSWSDDNFDLNDGESRNSGFLTPGTYAVSEIVPAGWDLISETCDDGSDPSSINLGAGETVICTFINQADANIIVEKQTDPDGSPQEFTFDPSWSDDNFQLSDGQTNDSGDLDPGVYSVSEIVPAGWELESVVCSDGSVPGAINLSAGETVTCVFNNQQDANIIVEKQTNPDGSTESFTFDPSWSDDNFQLSDGQTNDSGDLDPGTYSVTETVPAGWDLTSADCTGTNEADAITLAAGETVTCTFTNTQQGRIIVEKQTDPDGSSQLFEFTSSYGPGFSLSDDSTNDSGFLDAGTYSVSETVPTGWELKSVVCTDGSDPSAINLSAGETVTCVFNNQQDANIIVEKQTNPDGSTESFTFDPSWSDDNFQLSDGQTNDSGDLDPGTYSVTETVPAGWDLTSADCTGTNEADAITLAAGETVTCTFTNTQRGMVELLKLNNGVEETSIEWTFTLKGPEVDTSDTTPPALLDFDGAKLIPGETYTVCETGVPAGWSMEWTVDGVVVDPYDPNAGDPDASNDTWCVDITVEPGQTLGITVDNIPPPGGDQRTPGYWKNWNRCSPGNQAATADRNGSVDAGFYLLEDVLPIMVGDLVVEDCDTGRLLLDRRDLSGKNRKRASDAAYYLASHLIAAEANVEAGASTCPEITDAIAAAKTLLVDIEFDGRGQFLGPRYRGEERQDALDLATLLDAYNNGEVC